MHPLENNQEEKFLNYERIQFEGKWLWVPSPVELPIRRIIDRDDIMEKALAAWARLDGLPPLNFRFYGPHGTGKNAIVYRLAQLLKKDLYIINGHEELGPEDIACSATMTSSQTIEYVASPLFAAMLRGGICFFDEIGKAPSRALAPLASVLDDRRTLTSVLAGIHLKAHQDFLFCAALNEDEEGGFGLPGFIDERTRPAIYVGCPDVSTLEKILRSHLPGASNLWFTVFLEELRDKEISPRVAIILLSYAYRLSRADGRGLTRRHIRGFLRRAWEDLEKGKTDYFEEREDQDCQDDQDIDEGEDDDVDGVDLNLLVQEDEALH